MSRIHVCPLAHLGTVLRSSGARSVVSLLSPDAELPTFPVEIRRSLHLGLSDITEARPGHVLATKTETDRLLDFIGAWDRLAPLLIHCYAGVSRSTAAAFIGLCVTDPDQAEMAHALALRRASPTATPNLRLVTLADAALARGGRMVEAVKAIGRGAECFEGNVFSLGVPAAAAGARRAKMS